MHLSQPGFTYKACGSFSKNKKRNKSLKKQEIKIKILILVQFGFRNFEDLPKRTSSDKTFNNKAFDIA